MIFKFHIYVVILLGLSIGAASGPAWALEEMSDGEMNSVVGQAGVSILVNTVMVMHTDDSWRFDDTHGGTIEFSDITSRMVFSLAQPMLMDVYEYNGQTTFTDTWNGGASSQDYVLDNPLNGSTVLKLTMEQARLDIDAASQAVLFNSVNIGKVEIADLNIPMAEAQIFSYNGPGFDSALKFQLTADQFAYTFDNEKNIDPRAQLRVGSIMMAQSFSGDPLPSYFDTVSPGTPINSGSWTPQGYFKIGSMDPALSAADDPNVQGDVPTVSVRSFSLDFRTDASSLIPQKFNVDWQGNYVADADGLIGNGTTKPHLTNPRYNATYIDANIPVEGSIRFNTIQREYGGGAPTVENYGHTAIDGMKGFSRVEAPGFGIGNSPTTSTLYE